MPGDPASVPPRTELPAAEKAAESPAAHLQRAIRTSGRRANSGCKKHDMCAQRNEGVTQQRPELGIGSGLNNTMNSSLGVSMSELEFSSACPNSYLLSPSHPFSPQPHHTALLTEGFKAYLRFI